MAENQASGSAVKTVMESRPNVSLEVDLNRYGDLYLAALKGNWKEAKRIIDQDPEALTARLNLLSMRVLHVAAYSGHSKFVVKLVNMMSPDQVALQDNSGNTALHYAAISGTVEGARALVRKNPALTEMKALEAYIPLYSAVYPGATKGKEMACYLASVTKEPFVQMPKAMDNYHLLLELTNAGFHDITLDLLRRFCHLSDLATTTRYENRRNILSVLAQRPMDFMSGTDLNFWEKWIYDLAPCKPSSHMNGDMEDPMDDSEDLNWDAQVRKRLKGQIWKVVTSIIAHSTSQKLQDTKLRHKYALELVTFVCKRAKHLPNLKILDFFMESEVLNIAASSGIVEIVKECLQHFPEMIWYPKSSTTILHDAIKHRQESIFNLVSNRNTECLLAPRVAKKIEEIAMTEKTNSKTQDKDYSQKRGSEATMLDLAAKLAPSPQLSSISGTALQMQRELQWFQEVEKLVNTNIREKKDCHGLTPRQQFTKEHKKLVGQQKNG